MALAHQRHQGILYLTGDPLLDRLPEWLRDLTDHVLNGKATTCEVAYALAALVEMIENAVPSSDRTTH